VTKWENIEKKSESKTIIKEVAAIEKLLRFMMNPGSPAFCHPVAMQRSLSTVLTSDAPQVALQSITVYVLCRLHNTGVLCVDAADLTCIKLHFVF